MMSQPCRALPVLLLPFLLCGSAAAAPKNVSSAAPENLQASAMGVTLSLPDPNLPGKLLYYLRAVNASGSYEKDGYHGSLTKVWARLYQKGIPSAVLTAPQAQGGSVKKSVTITGTGGVVVKSLTQPGTWLKADTIVWYAGLNQIAATGHVIYRNGKNGAILTGPMMKSYTKLETVEIGSGHVSANL